MWNTGSVGTSILNGSMTDFLYIWSDGCGHTDASTFGTSGRLSLRCYSKPAPGFDVSSASDMKTKLVLRSIADFRPRVLLSLGKFEDAMEA